MFVFFHSFIGYSSYNIQNKIIIQQKKKKKRNKQKGLGATGLTSYARHRPLPLSPRSPVNNGMFFYDSPLERMVDGKFKSTLSLLGFGTFVGTGRNFRIAKSSAAQKALNALKQKMKKKS